MPIKFRCQKCNHLLGISRSKAGQQVDCPACGRATRVPDLDGNVRPIDEPQLKADDPKLAEAFKQLDALENQPLLFAVEPKVKVNSINLEPLPHHEIREIEIAPPGKPILLDEPEPVNALAELEQIIKSDNSEPKRHHQESSNPAAWWSLTFVLILAAFAGGFFLGMRMERNSTKNLPEQNKQTGQALPPQGQLDNTTANIFRIKGTVNYKLPSGEKSPDRGARVFLLPQSYTGSAKLTANGFRAGDQNQEFSDAVSKLSQLGGHATLVKDDGTYELTTPNNGDYAVVIVSRFAERTDEEGIKNLVTPLLTAFFEKPNEVMGKVGCHAHLIKLDQQKELTWNYTFSP